MRTIVRLFAFLRLFIPIARSQYNIDFAGIPTEQSLITATAIASFSDCVGWFLEMDATVFYPGITSSFPNQLGFPSTVPVIGATNVETPGTFIFINAMTTPFTPGQTVTFNFLFSGTSVDWTMINTPLSTTATQIITTVVSLEVVRITTAHATTLAVSQTSQSSSTPTSSAQITTSAVSQTSQFSSTPTSSAQIASATTSGANASESNSSSLSGEDIIAIVTSIAGTILGGLAVWIAWMTYQYMKATSSEKQGGYARYIARGRSPRRGRPGSSHEPKISVARA